MTAPGNGGFLLLGGVLSSVFSWSWTFFVDGPVGTAAITVTLPQNAAWTGGYRWAF